ncbi:MAG: recombinase RecA [Mycoplasmataceae bacterium]|nr:recombinase RecA [Mycoplasmataceae bacterium]
MEKKIKINENQIFDEAISQIEKQFGKGTVSYLNGEAENIEVIPSGSIFLDKALGVGGYPKGRIIEIFGNESSGKTTIALQAVAQCQKQGGKCAYVDLEHALDANFVKAIGVDLSKLLIAQPDSAEQAVSLIEALIKTGMIDLIVVDSVAAMVPNTEFEGNISDQTIGLHARLMSKSLRIIQALIAKDPTTLIFINQIREKVGVMFGNNETTTGGRALRFYASVRIELRRSELLKNGNDIVGIKTCAKIVKNKVAPPLEKAFIDIYFNKGIDHAGEIIDFALEKNIIEKRGSWFYLDEEKIGQGRDATKEILVNNPELFEKIKAKLSATDKKD